MPEGQGVDCEADQVILLVSVAEVVVDVDSQSYGICFYRKLRDALVWGRSASGRQS